ncbi:hypothetical protein HDA36_006244 [Nocardiopsis composta]|uniref:Uncharacterized protein n=1 Tax=Nocardiopsis composta TaxID=157465 RepID=A0A7W8QTD6_9ACTN|nr:hypothetical protein [Nocardiopsis composta]
MPSVVLSLSGMQAGPLKRGPAHCCRRRLLERALRGAPRPADAPDPGPTFAVAACLNPDSAGRRARPTRPAPTLPSLSPPV